MTRSHIAFKDRIGGKTIMEIFCYNGQFIFRTNVYSGGIPQPKDIWVGDPEAYEKVFTMAKRTLRRIIRKLPKAKKTKGKKVKYRY